MRLLNKVKDAVLSALNFGRGAKNAKAEKPTITSAAHTEDADRPLNGRRANARRGTILFLDDTAAQLSEKKPFFKMRSGGTYAVATRPVLQDDGKFEDVPTHFIRVDKNRTPLKKRKRTRRAARQLAEATA